MAQSKAEREPTTGMGTIGCGEGQCGFLEEGIIMLRSEA